MKKDIRKSIWRFLTSKLPEGQIVPWWAIVIRWILYPLDTFYWKISMSNGYDLRTNTWNIHGVRFSEEALYRIAKSVGAVYKITANDGIVTLERLHQLEVKS